MLVIFNSTENKTSVVAADSFDAWMHRLRSIEKIRLENIIKCTIMKKNQDPYSQHFISFTTYE